MGTKTKGYILGIVAAATYGMNPLFALPLYGEGMTADSVLFFRYLFAIPILGIMIMARGRSFKVSVRDLSTLIVMGLVVAFSSLGLFLSYTYMDAGIASTILFVYPIMVAVIMAVMFHERLSLMTIACIALVLGGIAMLYKGSGDVTLSFTGTVLVIASALSYAIYIVAVNRTGLRNVATLTVTFYVLLFGRFLLYVFGSAERYNIHRPSTGTYGDAFWHLPYSLRQYHFCVLQQPYNISDQHLPPFSAHWNL